MSFSDLLNKPLPSAKADDEELTTFESVDSDAETSGDIGDGEDGVEDGTEIQKGDTTDEACDKEENVDTEKCDGTKCEDGDDFDDDDIEDDLEDPEGDVASIIDDELDDDEDEDELDVDDLSSEELDALDDELTDDFVDDLAGEEDEVTLSPDEEIEADDMMSTAATTIVVNDELNATEKAEFLESAEQLQIAVNEGLLLESDIDDLMYDLGMVTEGKNYNKKMLIRLDKKSKMKQLYSLAVNVSACAHHDPDYLKLKKVLRMRKQLRARLRKKYHAEAMKRMKVYYKRLTSSKSSVLSKIGKKISK